MDTSKIHALLLISCYFEIGASVKFIFNCSDTRSSIGRPTTVHRLRPADIEVVGAMGDSVTAGFGMKSTSVMNLFFEWRGLVFSIGGDGSLDGGISTIPNILKKFNPDIYGYSTGFGLFGFPPADKKFNVALTGAESDDALRQARDLVDTMKSGMGRFFNLQWKLVTIFLGQNDHCGHCDKMPKFKRITPAVTIKSEYRDEKGRIRTRTRRVHINKAEESPRVEQPLKPEITFEVQQEVQPEVQTDIPSTYATERERRVELWNELLPVFVSATVENEAPAFHSCAKCEDPSQFRCRDCGPHVHYCGECLHTFHKDMWFHVAERYDVECGYMPVRSDMLIELPPHCCSSRKYSRVLKIWDFRGRCHIAEVNFCDCEDESITLIRNRLWPSTPQQPRVAFDFQLMDWWEALQLEGHLATNAFCNTLRWLNRSMPKHEYVPLYKQLVQDTCDLYRHFKFLQRKQLMTETEQHTCPACPNESGKVFMSMDACFSLVKKGQDSATIKSQHKETMFLDQEKVDTFVAEYGIKDSQSDLECNDFSAGDKVRSIVSNKKLSVTAVFGTACKHEMPVAFFDLKHGERFSYAVYMMRYLKQFVNHDQQLNVLYDIACTLSAHIKRHCPDLQVVPLAIPVFHAYGHKTQCQVQLNPRHLSGFGLTDGEGMERLWSYLGKFAKITKEMTAGRRKDLLTDALLHFQAKKLEVIETTLVHRYVKALKLQEVCHEKMKDLKNGLSENGNITVEDIQSWHVDQQKAATAPATNVSKTLLWDEKYVDMLIELTNSRILVLDATDNSRSSTLSDRISRLEANLKATEKAKKIKKRWQNTSQSYISAKSRLIEKKTLAMMKLMQSKARDLQYLNSLRAKYSDGQAVAKRLAKQQTKTAQSLRRHLKQLNALQEGPGLEFTDVNKPDATVYTQRELSQIPGTPPLTLRNEIVEVWLLLKRAEEEVKFVREEMAAVLTHFSKVYQELVAKCDEITECDTNKYRAGLRQLYVKKRYHAQLLLENFRNVFSPFLSGNTSFDLDNCEEMEDLEECYFEELIEDD